MQEGGLSEGGLNTSSSFHIACCTVQQQQEYEHPGCTAAVVFQQAEDGWLGYRISSRNPCFASPVLPYRRGDDKELSPFPVPSRLQQREDCTQYFTAWVVPLWRAAAQKTFQKNKEMCMEIIAEWNSVSNFLNNCWVTLLHYGPHCDSLHLYFLWPTELK